MKPSGAFPSHCLEVCRLAMLPSRAPSPLPCLPACCCPVILLWNFQILPLRDRTGDACQGRRPALSPCCRCTILTKKRGGAFFPSEGPRTCPLASVCVTAGLYFHRQVPALGEVFPSSVHLLPLPSIGALIVVTGEEHSDVGGHREGVCCCPLPECYATTVLAKGCCCQSACNEEIITNHHYSSFPTSGDQNQLQPTRSPGISAVKSSRSPVRSPPPSTPSCTLPLSSNVSLAAGRSRQKPITVAGGVEGEEESASEKMVWPRPTPDFNAYPADQLM